MYNRSLLTLIRDWLTKQISIWIFIVLINYYKWNNCYSSHCSTCDITISPIYSYYYYLFEYKIFYLWIYAIWDLWKKQHIHYVNSKKKIESLKGDLDVEMSRATEDEMRITTINKELLEAYRAEEEYWKQRSRQMWLTLGDKKHRVFSCFH